MAQKTVTTTPTKSKWVKKMKWPVIIGATLLGGMGAYGAGLSGGGQSLFGNIKLGTSTLFGNLFSGGGGSSAAAIAPMVSGPHGGVMSTGGTALKAASSGGGIGGFFSNLLGGMFGGGGGTGISLGNIISGIGGFFGSKANYELGERELDIREKLGLEGIRIKDEELALETMKAEAAIAAEKRQTAIGSTFMGHTSPIAAAAEGLTGVEQGLQVADTWVTPEVRKKAGGALGGSQPGLITQAKQAQV